MDVGDNTTTGDGGLDERVELLITTDGELEVTGRDTLHLEVARGVAGELHHLSAQVLEDRGGVHGSSRTDTVVGVNAGLEETVDTTDGELETSAHGAGDGLGLAALGLALATLGLTALSLTLTTTSRRLGKCKKDKRSGHVRTKKNERVSGTGSEAKRGGKGKRGR